MMETCRRGMGEESLSEAARRSRRVMRTVFLGGILGVMLFAPLILLIGTGVEIVQDPHFVTAPQLIDAVYASPAVSPPLPDSDIALPLTDLPFGTGIPTLNPDRVAVASSFPYTVYVASFRKGDRARGLVERLRGEGQLTFDTYLEVPGMGGWFRVFCGNYPTQESAQAWATRLKREEGVDASVVHKTVALAVDGPLSREAALVLERRLYAKGFFAYAMPLFVDGGPVQLLVGAFQGESRAQEMQSLLAEEGFSSIFVKR